MPKSEPKYGTPTQENPEWTAERLRNSVSFNQLPAAVQAAARRRGERGPQKKPTKALVSLRLSPDVLIALRATGPGWQSRVDEVLRNQFLATSPRKAAVKVRTAKAGKSLAATA